MEVKFADTKNKNRDVKYATVQHCVKVHGVKHLEIKNTKDIVLHVL